jgi:putative transposase
MIAADKLSQGIRTKTACDALGVPRATFYRRQKTVKVAADKKPLQQPPLGLSELERQAVFELLHSERFVDHSPGEIVATLLAEGTYWCSERTMYRLLAQENELKERRQAARHSHRYEKPELLATKPNEVWSWDITKLLGPQKWSYFYLYVILDVFSRYVVGWMVADRESSELAKRLIGQTYQKQGIRANQLVLHADRGPSMKSKPVAFLLADLGITKTHSRPYTSDDNPFSEAQFKTLKYCPQFPKRFGCIQDAKAFCRAFFSWYNLEHRHTGINRLTPKMLHHGEAEQVIDNRNRTLAKAFLKTPARFKYKKPGAGDIPKAVWINKPEQKEKEKEEMNEENEKILEN